MDPTAPNKPDNPASSTGPVTTEPIGQASSSPPDPPMGISQNQNPPKPNIFATSIDPNDPLSSRVSESAPQDDNSILPGQFVVAGGDTFVPQPAAQGQFESNRAEAPITGGYPPPPPMPAPLEPGPQLAAQSDAPVVSASQPDPTPYTPPPPTPGYQPTASAPGSIIGKLRIAAIALGGVVLIGAIGVVIWIYFLSKPPQEAAKIEVPPGSVLEEPTPFPKRIEGGFGTLPALLQSTGSAGESTPAAAPDL